MNEMSNLAERNGTPTIYSTSHLSRGLRGMRRLLMMAVTCSAQGLVANRYLH
jgi:hypothetical protein